MRSEFANWLNSLGMHSDDAGYKGLAMGLYRSASAVAPGWSTPWYNRGLIAKYKHQWNDSLNFNQRAVELNPKNEAAWWNLGIAATALRDWPEARRAWRAYGVDIQGGTGEVDGPRVTGCIRLNPNNDGEVVWGTRLDPARFRIDNVPLPESRHRFQDIVLNDGAPDGTRVLDGVEIPILNELQLWQSSNYSTFCAAIHVPTEAVLDRLKTIFSESGAWLEDWSSIWWTCAACSRGALDHSHDEETFKLDRKFGFAGRNDREILDLLERWKSTAPDARVDNFELALAAVQN